MTQDKINVVFSGGCSIHSSSAVNFMQVDLEDITLYSEILLPDEIFIEDCYGELACTDEFFGYEALKADIIEQAIAAGVDPGNLCFWLD